MTLITWPSTAEWEGTDVTTALSPPRRFQPPSLTLDEERRPRPATFCGRPTSSMASWAMPFLGRLRRLVQAGARTNQVLEKEAVWASVRVLNRVMDPDTPAPDLVLTVHGGLQLEWHMAGIDLEVEVFPNGDVVAAYFDEESGVDLDSEGSESLDMIRAALSEMSTRGAARSATI